ncbi:phosphatase PAP2 family protein [Microbulbifer sp. OS29]|uniref:undecaprenyl-diphosphate phosphatase n=1 Tax=Microbulbifer okhotskensis TaxID=2926617 RepID=A0A9X2EKT1_9GAMM|nr:phosphatase PAP2 family protein [Microbulbifer okhotskensis]MCO1334054.1 phosphatase PAP2 family protein [Microbulbifer okhotskensis]
MNLKSFDVSVVLYMAGRASRPGSRRRYLWLSKSGDGWVAGVLFFTYVWLTSAVQLLYLAGTAVALERSLYWGIKNTTRRLRPPQVIPGMRSVIVAHDRFSLPSGHTSCAFLFITAMTIHVSPIWSFGYIWATCVGAARVGLGVHFPSDICAGAILGTSVGLIMSIAFL